MRFTRPGARPSQRPQARLDSTQLGGRVLGPRVEDEGARADLGPREVLQLVAAAVGRIELDMEVMVAAPAAGRLLVHRHHIWKRLAEQPVVLLQKAFEGSSERLVVVPIEVREGAS